MNKFVIQDGVYSKQTDGIWIVLDHKKDSYLELNEVASLIWSELHSPVTREEIAQKICDTYDVSYEDSLRDVKDFVKSHLKKNFLREVKLY